MMNRLELIRIYLNEYLSEKSCEEQRQAIIHLYGVSQFCTLLALKRNMDSELAAIAGLLHDIYTFKEGAYVDHAQKGASLAREILEHLSVTTPSENDIICCMIRNHSNKLEKDTPMDELLKDADVFQHCLYGNLEMVIEKERKRFKQLMMEFNLVNQ
jgi:HD superfamily phosphodiesterase